MSKYVDSVLADVKAKNPGEPEFIQAVDEVLTTLDPVLKATVGLAWAKLISRGLLLFGCLFLVPLVFKRADSVLERRAH